MMVEFWCVTYKDDERLRNMGMEKHSEELSRIVIDMKNVTSFFESHIVFQDERKTAVNVTTKYINTVVLIEYSQFKEIFSKANGKGIIKYSEC